MPAQRERLHDRALVARWRRLTTGEGGRIHALGWKPLARKLSERPHARFDVGPRKPLRDDLVDLALGLVACRIEERAMVRLVEVALQLKERRERDLSRLELLEDDREASCEPGRGRASMSGVVAHPKPPATEVVQRRASEQLPEPPPIDLDEEDDETRG